MQRRRPPASAVLAACLVLAIGSWAGDGFAAPAVSTSRTDLRTGQPIGTRRSAAHLPPRAAGSVPGSTSIGSPASSHRPGSAGQPSRTGSQGTAGAPGTPGGTDTPDVPGSPTAPPPPPPPASPSFAPGTVARTTGSDAVALTFDDGPGDQTLAILALLRENGVKATFCLIGIHVRERPDLVQAIVRDGHTLCNHTWLHDMRLGQRSAAEIRSDLQRTSDEIHRAVPGVPIKYFRHPGGMWTPAAVSIAQEMGMTSLGWDVDPSDWNVAGWSPGASMTNHIIGNVEQHVHPGAIVLSHDAGGDRSSTVAAYRTLLPYLLNERHLSLVPLPNGVHPPHPRLDREDLDR
jgi:peptidoglycan-N-acetylglucosamine deacetylase